MSLVASENDCVVNYCNDGDEEEEEEEEEGEKRRRRITR